MRMLRMPRSHLRVRVRHTKTYEFYTRNSLRVFSSESKNSSSSSPIFRLSVSDLGLDEATWIQPALVNIRQLPEIEQALKDPTSPAVQDALKRATDIFQSMNPEHCAVLAWLATAQERTGNVTAAIHTLEQLQKVPLHSHFELDLAMAKALWLEGDFARAQTLCDELVETSQADSSSPLMYASARTGQALARLTQVETLDDVFSVRDPFRMVIKFLEDYPTLRPALACAHLNMGVAEAVYAHVVSRERSVDAPLDGAMRAWKQGLTLVQRHAKASLIAPPLQARLQANLAWGLLHMMPRDVPRASEFIGEALQVYDTKWPENVEKEGLCRVLTLAAQCYHESQQAITAQGLLQTALDLPTISVPEQLDRIQAAKAYAQLCQDWEKREHDAAKWNQQADDWQAELSNGWQHKPDIYSTLWFWTPNLFVK